VVVHELRLVAESDAGYVFTCTCGARGEPDPDRQSALDAFEQHAAAQDLD
jgi:hypothetical protein